MAPGRESSPWLRVLAAATGWRMRWQPGARVELTLCFLTDSRRGAGSRSQTRSARSESARDDVRLVAHPRSSSAELRVGSVSRVGSARRRSFSGEECCRPLPTGNRPHWIGGGLPFGRQRPDPGNRSPDPKRRARNSSSRDRRAAVLDRPLRRSFGEHQVNSPSWFRWTAIRSALEEALFANDEQRTAKRLTPYNCPD